MLFLRSKSTVITPALIPRRRQKCKLHFPMAAAQVSEITENPLYKCNLDHEVPTSYQQTSKCNATFLPSYSTPVAQSDHQVQCRTPKKGSLLNGNDQKLVTAVWSCCCKQKNLSLKIDVPTKNSTYWRW